MLFRCYFFFALQSRVERVPAQARALYACRKFEHSGKDLQSPEMVLSRLGIEFAGDHLMKFVEDHLGLLAAFALDELRHHRRRCLRDRADPNL